MCRWHTRLAVDAFDLVNLQFDVGTATELALRQSEGVLEQTRANYTGFVRSRAQAENAKCIGMIDRNALVDVVTRLRLRHVLT